MQGLTRNEQDALGVREIASGVLYGINTLRAVENFPISGVTLSHFPDLIRALAMVKSASARANMDLGVLDRQKAEAIMAACSEIIDGEYHDQFIVDMIQGGAGTSTNMNANEVIANICAQVAREPLGSNRPVHPNDHVNKSQSTNDVYPTAIRLAVLASSKRLVSELACVAKSFATKAQEFDKIKKVGRTQLQDAVPITLGREFFSFAAAMHEEITRVEDLSKVLKTVNLGGTAVGTGINAPSGYAEAAVANLSALSGYELRCADDLVDASSDMGALVSFSGLLRRIAIKMSKICNDLRLLSSGPRAGFGEIELPAVQAGSSIMPGKVNPVIPEMVSQVAYQVVGNDMTITMAAEAGQLQLNAMEPVIAYNLLESMRILENAMRTLRLRCVDGILANEPRCAELLSNSLVLATILVPELGYDQAAKVAKEALTNDLSIEAVIVERGLMSRERFAELIEKEFESSAYSLPLQHPNTEGEKSCQTA
jgi:aspartate ammonia-lyase